MEDPPSKKVSIIIPFYNGIPFLAKCLDNISHQSLREIEILLIDDGSTDGSVEIVKRYSHADPRIKLLKQPHNGPGTARNLGIKYSSAPYITFVDCDDAPDADYCQSLYEIAIDNDSDIVISRYRNVHSNGLVSTSPLDTISKNGIENIRKLYIGKIGMGLYSKLYKTDFIRHHNIIFPPLFYNEDRHFLLQCLYFSKKTSPLNKVVYQRNLYPFSAMNRIQQGHLRDAQYVLDLDRDFLKKFKSLPELILPLYLAHLKVVNFIFRRIEKEILNISDSRIALLQSLNLDMSEVKNPFHRMTLMAIKAVQGFEIKNHFRKFSFSGILIRMAIKFCR